MDTELKNKILALNKKMFSPKTIIGELNIELQKNSTTYLPNNAEDLASKTFYNKERSLAYLEYSKKVIRPILDTI